MDFNGTLPLERLAGIFTYKIRSIPILLSLKTRRNVRRKRVIFLIITYLYIIFRSVFAVLWPQLRCTVDILYCQREAWWIFFLVFYTSRPHRTSMRHVSISYVCTEVASKLVEMTRVMEKRVWSNNKVTRDKRKITDRKRMRRSRQ